MSHNLGRYWAKFFLQPACGCTSRQEVVWAPGRPPGLSSGCSYYHWPKFQWQVLPKLLLEQRWWRKMVILRHRWQAPEWASDPVLGWRRSPIWGKMSKLGYQVHLSRPRRVGTCEQQDDAAQRGEERGPVGGRPNSQHFTQLGGICN